MAERARLTVRWQRPVFPEYQETILDGVPTAPTSLNLTEIDQ